MDLGDWGHSQPVVHMEENHVLPPALEIFTFFLRGEFGQKIIVEDYKKGLLLLLLLKGPKYIQNV